LRTALLVILVALMTAVPEVANGQWQPQPRPARPYRGLFASGTAETSQSLIGNATLGGGYDDNILFEAGQVGGGGGNPLIGQSGAIGSADGSLFYTLSTPRVGLGSSFATMFRYFPGTRDPSLVAHNANLGASFKMGRRTTLLAGQSVQYQPYMFTAIFGLLPSPGLDPFESPTLGQPVPPLIDQATSREVYLSSSSSLSVDHNFTQRLSFTTGYGYQWSDTAFLGGKFTSHRGNAGFRYSLTRSLGLRFGYAYQQGQFPGSPEPTRSHTADVGVDYNKALSFSRRTTLSFATGTSAVNYLGSTSIQAVGFARLNHEIGRTWGATGGYSRSVQFVDMFLAPVLYDSVDVGFGGLINRRVEVRSGLWASIGDVGVQNVSPANDFDTFLASANISVALNTYMRVGAYYAFYRYRYDEFAFLPAGVPQNIDRQSFRVQVSLWAPLMQRARR